MKKNLTYLLSCILIHAAGFSKAQETITPPTNKTTSGEPFGSAQGRQNRTIDSLLQVLKNLTSSPELNSTIDDESGGFRMDTTVLSAFNELSKQYRSIGSYDPAMYYARRALDQGEKLLSVYKNDKYNSSVKKGLALAYNNKGLVYWDQRNYKNGLNNYLKALIINKEIGYTKGIANNYNNIGLIYWNQGNYEKAIESLLKSLKITEATGDRNGTSVALSSIGNIYANQKNYENALKFYFKALKMTVEVGNKMQEANVLNNIGEIYSYLNNNNKALEYLFNSLKIRTEIGDKSGIASVYNKIGEIYFIQAVADPAGKSSEDLLKKALDCHFKALEIDLKIGNIQGAGIVYKNIANIYKKQGKLNESYDYASKSLKLCKEVGYKEGIMNAYFALSELHERKGDFKHALEYQKLFSDIKDSLLNERFNKQIMELDAKYDSEKKDNAIQLLNKEKESQARFTASEKRKQQVILFSVTGFTLLLIGFAILIYRSFRQKQLLNKELEKLSIGVSD